MVANVANQQQIYAIRILMGKINSSFKELKTHFAPKKGYEKGSMGVKKDLVSLVEKYEQEIEDYENKLMVPLALIGFDYRTVIPNPFDDRIDNRDQKIKNKAIHYRHQLWVTVMRDGTKPWGT